MRLYYRILWNKLLLQGKAGVFLLIVPESTEKHKSKELQSRFGPNYGCREDKRDQGAAGVESWGWSWGWVLDIWMSRRAENNRSEVDGARGYMSKAINNQIRQIAARPIAAGQTPLRVDGGRVLSLLALDPLASKGPAENTRG